MGFLTVAGRFRTCMDDSRPALVGTLLSPRFLFFVTSSADGSTRSFAGRSVNQL